MDRRTVIVVHRDVEVEPPVGMDSTLDVERSRVMRSIASRMRRHRQDTPRATALALPATETSEDHRATCRQLDRSQPGVHLVGSLAGEHHLANRNSDNTAVAVVLPMVKATDHRPIAPRLTAQRIEPMGADVLEAAQLLAETLNKHRTCGDRGAKPIAIPCDVAGEAKKRPNMLQAPLLVTKSLRVNNRLRPRCRQAGTSGRFPPVGW